MGPCHLSRRLQAAQALPFPYLGRSLVEICVPARAYEMGIGEPLIRVG
jgi:hypothetical protein